jgi:hypothetical protein
MELTKLLPTTKYLQSHLRAASAQTDPLIAEMHASDAMRTAEAIVAALKTEIDAVRKALDTKSSAKAKPATKAPAKPE